MLVNEVARKYARALFMSARERGLMDQAYDQCSKLQRVLEADRSLLIFLGSPKIEQEQKQELLRRVFASRLERLFIEFLIVLVQKHRAVYMPEVLDEFNRLVEYDRGIARATVISAVPLETTERERLTKKLEAKTDREIKLESKVEPDILGGLIVIMADEIVDGSIRHDLELMAEQLHKVKVN